MKSIKPLLLSVLALSLILAGCQNEEAADTVPEESVTVNLTLSMSANAIPYLYIMEEDTLGEDFDLNAQIHITREEATAKILKKDVQGSMMSVQESANIFNKGLPVVLVNATYGASFFLISENEAINTYEDLRDRVIWTSMKGGPVAFTMNQLILNQTSLDPEKDLSYQFMAFGELTNLILNDLKDIEVYSLRDPYVSQILAEKPQARIILNFDEEWEKAFGNRIPNSGLAMDRDFIDTHPEFITALNEAYKEAIDWMNDNPGEAAALGSKYLKGQSEAILRSSIENLNLSLMEGAVEEQLKDYIGLWLAFNPEMVGSKMPLDEFYHLD
ncbi:MAG: hypothetical protein AVO33_10955 [delta proteobacterium ML8_F1]|nr:MAG: hypothetical protein AVO33_10955 [delta proteobacterium ML8_F1]